MMYTNHWLIHQLSLCLYYHYQCVSAINSKLPIIVFLDDWYVVIDFVVRVVCLWTMEGTTLIPVSDGLSIFSFSPKMLSFIYYLYTDVQCFFRSCTEWCNLWWGILVKQHQYHYFNHSTVYIYIYILNCYPSMYGILVVYHVVPVIWELAMRSLSS